MNNPEQTLFEQLESAADLRAVELAINSYVDKLKTMRRRYDQINWNLYKGFYPFSDTIDFAINEQGQLWLAIGSKLDEYCELIRRYEYWPDHSTNGILNQTKATLLSKALRKAMQELETDHLWSKLIDVTLVDSPHKDTQYIVIKPI